MRSESSYWPVITLSCAILSAAMAAPALADPTSDAVFVQRMLNRLGYALGRIDGKFGPTSQKALAAFLATKGIEATGKLTPETLAAFKGLPEVSTAMAYVPKSGAELEIHTSDSIYPPFTPPLMEKMIQRAQGTLVDIDKDGDLDVVYLGAVRAKNYDSVGQTQGGVCGTKRCEGLQFPPMVMVNDGSGAFVQARDAFTDTRSEPGISAGNRAFIADFNRDGLLDIYAVDYGYGTHKGYRDSYYLATGPLQWTESSATHLNPPEVVNFDHGSTIGDIDGDGDLDLILTTLKSKASLLCLINDGAGVLTKTECTTPVVRAFALELGDMDNDGDLDLVVGGDEIDDTLPARILLNDGLGQFGKGPALPVIGKEYGGMPELSLWDLDLDGNLDVVISRVGFLYVGTAVQLIANSPDGFKNTLIEVVDAPDDYVPVYEGNEWNNHFHTVRFTDANKDGLPDILLVNADSPGWPNYDKVAGAVLENQGGFSFNLITHHPGLIYLNERTFQVDESLLVQSLSHSAGKPVDTPHSRSFAKIAKKFKIDSLTSDEQTQFIRFEVPLGMARSGAVALGYRNWQHKSYTPNKVQFELLLDYGGKIVAFPACLEFFPRNQFTGAGADLSPATLGGAFTDLSDEGKICQLQGTNANEIPGDIGKRADAAGVFALLYDVQNLRHDLLQAFVGVPEEERRSLIERFD